MRDSGMNILEYIDELMDQGMSEEDASLCADIMFNLNWDTGYDDDYDPYDYGNADEW